MRQDPKSATLPYFVSGSNLSLPLPCVIFIELKKNMTIKHTLNHRILIITNLVFSFFFKIHLPSFSPLFHFSKLGAGSIILQKEPFKNVANSLTQATFHSLRERCGCTERAQTEQHRSHSPK